jgi:hypothetical protein
LTGWLVVVGFSALLTSSRMWWAEGVSHAMRCPVFFDK